MNKRQSWNMILLFCILIFGFTAATWITPTKDFSETENRALAQFPRLSLETVLNGEFESDYEEYLSDQFPGRDGWIGLKTDAERAMLRQESKDIYFAEDGYLIEKHTGSFTTDTAKENIGLLAGFFEKYEEAYQGHMTAMVVPNAVDILRDKLPPYASPYDQEEYLAQIQEALPQGVWFDTSSVLEEHKEEEIYYRTDHHWQTKAAFYVWQEWAGEQGFGLPSEEDYTIEAVTEEFEGTIQSKLGISVQPDSIQIYRQKEDPFYTVDTGNGEESYSVYDLDALNTKSKYDIYFGGNHALVKIQTRADTGRRILLIKDSYAHCFAPFLITEFDEIDLVDIRYYNQNLSQLIEEGDYTDLMFLYNASGFAEDVNFSKLLL